MTLFFRCLAFTACCIALAWVIFGNPGYDAWLGLFAALTALVGSFISPIAKILKGGMNQKVGSHGLGVQSGRDAVVNISRTSGEKD